jgi:hypothetical protein
MRFLTMLATKCKVCKKRSICNYKRMVACALAELPLQHHAYCAMDMKADCVAPMIRKRDLTENVRYLLCRIYLIISLTP